MPKDGKEKRTAAEKNKTFENTTCQYMDTLYNAALRMTKNESDAKDLVQDTYLRAYRFFDKFETGTNVKAWLFAILKNTYINAYKKRRKEPEWIDVSTAEESGELTTKITPEDEVINNLLDDDIAAAIDALPNEFRICVMADINGFTYREIAKIIERPIGTVMSRLHRGRKLLKKALREYARQHGYIKDE